jgi:hypothetical protein
MRRGVKVSITAYAVLLTMATLVRPGQQQQPLPRSGERHIEVAEVEGDGETGRRVRITYFDSAPHAASATAVHLIHGSPRASAANAGRAASRRNENSLAWRSNARTQMA